MFQKMSWRIKIGSYTLKMLESVEINKSVDTLADTCVIKVPGTAYGAALQVEGKVKVGDAVKVELGYDENYLVEFEGFLQRIDTDNGSLTFNCEDGLFLLRKDVKDKQFKNAEMKEIAQYVVSQTGSGLKVNCTLTLKYDKFVISRATGYDVLKKLQEETASNIYIKDGALQIHPLYIEKGGDVIYSFQKNIESADLKYRKKEDRKVEVIVENTAPDGKKIEVRSGTTGGDKKTFSGAGMSKDAMKKKADHEFAALSYDGYEGSITGWLIPLCEPTYSVKIKDDDYEFKTGIYYAIAVTTTMDSSGAKRKVQLGRRLA
jgi:hypothetical protein